jgi:hypothetical protein
MRHTAVLAMLAGMSLGGAAAAQDLVLELVQLQDITALNNFNPDNPELYIGTNPATIAWDGNSLFVGGFNNSASTQTINLVQIIDFLSGPGVRSFAQVEGSAKLAGAFWYWAGLDWDDERGLLGSWNDFGGGQPQFMVFERDLSGVTLDFSAGSTGGRGRADCAWDRGFDGTGFSILGGTGAVASVLDNDEATPSGWGISSLGQAGPIGLDATNNLAPVYAAFQSPPPGILTAPRLIPSNGDATGTLWRALDIKGPWVIARADNDLIISERDANNGTVGEPNRVDAGSFPFEAGQNAVVLDNQQCGDTFFMWNDRPSGCSGTLTDVMKLTRTDGSEATYSIVDGNGDPVSFTSHNCYYSMFWSSADQLLFICEFSTGIVYVLTPSCGGPQGCNEADLAEPFGILDLADITAFIGAFVAQQPLADLAEPFGIFDLSDISAFVTAFTAGCP